MMPWLILIVLCFPSLGWAETTVIYRKSDKLVVGYVTPPHSVEVELKNLTQSELGGMTSDYAITTVATRQPSEQAVIQPDGTALLREHPDITKSKQDRISAREKLKNLGFTDEELKELRL